MIQVHTVFQWATSTTPNFRSAEILYTEEGKARQIRRAERPEELF